MTILLLTATLLAAIATVLVVRSLTFHRVRTAKAMSRISGYGFTAATGVADAAEPSEPIFPGLTARLGHILPARLRRNEEEVRDTLLAAGLYRTTASQYFGYRALLVLAGFCAWIWLWSALGVSTLAGIALGVVIVGSCWLLPKAELRRRRDERLRRIDRSLPDLVDFLVVTVEAGIGFPAALQAAAARFPAPLGEELRLTVQEQRMGLSVEDSLRNLLARTGTAGMSSFVRSLVQGETLGVSIGQILRSLAAEMRKRRRQAAEEQAHKAPIKMLFPLAFLIFPALFLVVLGPAAYDLVTTLGGQ